MDSASLCTLAGRYDNPIPTPFLAPINCSKIPAQDVERGGGEGNIRPAGICVTLVEAEFHILDQLAIRVGFLDFISVQCFPVSKKQAQAIFMALSLYYSTHVNESRFKMSSL
jgi:hypothetical protein